MKKILKVIVPLLLVALIIASIGWYLFVYDRDFTRDMMLKMARYQADNGNARSASWFYELAYDHTGQDANVAIELANQYKGDGNYTKAEYTLTNAIADGGTVELYTALCKTFVEQDKLLDAVNMLDSITDPEMKAQLDALRPAAVAADYEPGFYTQYISVSLSAGSGTVYYTTDGDYPSTGDEAYGEPIALSQGETTIKAVCVGDNGLVSPLTTVSYTVGGVIELVQFTDPAVEASLRSLLGADEDDEIYTNQLWDITEFTYPADAVNFTDISYLPYLTSLTIDGQSIDSLNFLSGLASLEELVMTNCKFPAEDLSYVASLPVLQKLTMENCSLSTIANLEGAQKLSYLDLSSNTIRNLEALTDMSSLRELYLDHNAVTSLDAISALTGLEVLDVSYNSLTSTAALAGCASLRTLNVSNNSLTGLEKLDSLSVLTSLSANHNSITDVTILGKCTGLTELNINNNQISDISALASLTTLETLDFSYNSVAELPNWSEGGALRTINGSNNALESIDILQKMENLSYVYMDYNALTSIDAIAECYHLVLVNVYGNPIEDVSALTAHNIIVNYDPTN